MKKSLRRNLANSFLKVKQDMNRLRSGVKNEVSHMKLEISKINSRNTVIRGLERKNKELENRILLQTEIINKLKKDHITNWQLHRDLNILLVKLDSLALPVDTAPIYQKTESYRPFSERFFGFFRS